MATTAETSRTFKIVAVIAAILLVVAAAIAYLQYQGSGAPVSKIDQLGAQATEILQARTAVDNLNDAASSIRSSVDNILEISDPLLDVSGATAVIQEFQQRAARIAQTAPGIVANPDAVAVASTMVEDTEFLRSVTSALAGEDTDLDIRALAGNGQETVVVPLAEQIDQLETAVAEIETNVGKVAGIGEAGFDMATTAARLANASAASAGPLPGFLRSPWIPLGLIGLAVALLAFLIFLNSKSSQFEITAKVQAEQNERNQQAILRLLDEMGSLADGDLTVEATVTEDITGTIADSFNFAIEELRKLVATVNETAIMVDSAAKQTENTAANMAKAADNQTREINAATESIVSMAKSIEEVSGNAERSSDVARHSVEVAHKGGEAVRRTIDGMNTIRETIQDTSKRIKRLGESSQEIGNIIELINDIAEQTNILALNASIQASMAGEAGRGFAVVADEVQRLAERSTNATKQIEVLVRTIQADTNEAVVSMERSTTDVVGGALLAENAGAALDEIEQVSNQIASLVQNISGSARQQASSAADVTKRTTRLREIGEQTGRATTATAAAISKLAELATQLRKTVAGFTLPNEALQAKTLVMTPSNAQASKPSPQAKAS
jgi:twitching motility protein PilJ